MFSLPRLLKAAYLLILCGAILFLCKPSSTHAQRALAYPSLPMQVNVQVLSNPFTATLQAQGMLALAGNSSTLGMGAGAAGMGGGGFGGNGFGGNGFGGNGFGIGGFGGNGLGNGGFGGNGFGIGGFGMGGNGFGGTGFGVSGFAGKGMGGFNGKNAL